MAEELTGLQAELIRDWFAPPTLRDQILYHYTTVEGVLGIVRSGVLRGTSAAYLNDVSEISYGLGVCREAIAEDLLMRSDPAEMTLLERTIKGLQDEKGDSVFEVYVTSFTEAKDDLTQWRAYGSSEAGYALGFKLAQFSERDILRFPQKVEYEPLVQRQKVRTAVDLACRFLPRASSAHAGWDVFTDLLMHMRRLACTFKHTGFASEREWRSIWTATETWYDVQFIDFLPSRGLIKPYLHMLEGSRESRRLPITELRVGSVSNPHQALHGIRLMLRRFGYEGVHVSMTEVPFR